MSAPLFFATPADLRAWFEANHATAEQLWIGYHKKATGRASVTWEESRDEALCFGWIDGVRRSIDDARFKVRFTPRREGSDWSLVNIGRAKELKAQGRMRRSGVAAFAHADEKAARAAHRRRRTAALEGEYLERLKAVSEAWDYYRAQPPGYRRDAARWVMDAKRDETRLRRLAALIEDCAAGRRIKPLRRD